MNVPVDAPGRAVAEVHVLAICSEADAVADLPSSSASQTPANTRVASVMNILSTTQMMLSTDMTDMRSASEQTCAAAHSVLDACNLLQ